jgi:hypothetical protein
LSVDAQRAGRAVPPCVIAEQPIPIRKYAHPADAAPQHRANELHNIKLLIHKL